jgi:hypothetical protein
LELLVLRCRFFKFHQKTETDVFSCHDQRRFCEMLDVGLPRVGLPVCGSYWTLICLWISSCPFDGTMREISAQYFELTCGTRAASCGVS